MSKTIDHDVVTRRDKINYTPTEEICVRHSSNVYENYCEPCELPSATIVENIEVTDK